MKPTQLNPAQAAKIAKSQGTPVYVYDKQWLEKRAKSLLGICREQGVLLRYAVKANPHLEIIQLFNGLGLQFDASSVYEAEQLLELGIEAEKISLSSQQAPQNIKQTLDSGVKFVATSLHQLDLVKESGWQGSLGVRLNPGLGSGHSRRTTTGGVTSSFGIWHEYLNKVLAYGFNIDRIQTHVGAGVDPSIWQDVAKESLALTEQVNTVRTLNLGGGFKVARMPDEKDADMAGILEVFSQEAKAFQEKTGRHINLEIEPGTWLVAGGGVLLSRIVDIVDTGAAGYNFLKLDSGMNDFLRPTLYGAQHHIKVLNSSNTKEDYVVVGHNCESGDILTTEPGKPENIMPRRLSEAKIGDLVSIGSAGAYSASMRAIGYNSFPSAKEVFV